MLDYMRFKEVNDLYSRGDYTKARRVLMELHAQCIALYDQIDTLKNRVQDCEDILFLSRNLYFDKRMYWVRCEDLKLGPFCPDCYNDFGVLNKLVAHGNESHCPYCGNVYPAGIAPEIEHDMSAPMHTEHHCIPFSKQRLQ